MARPLLRLTGTLFFLILLAAGTAWSATALWLQLGGAWRIGALSVLALAVLATLLARRSARRLGWLALAICALCVGGWYQTIRPSDARDWAPDVARGVRAEREGSLVTLRDIRDFQWSSETEATRRWITETVDLDALDSVDMITSVWDNPEIAHLLVSFGFADGNHVVFSVEIRKEADESFNEIGGFFRQFELVLIAATENDIVKLRTNYREEDVSLFPVTLSPEQRREMFLAYVSLAQRLEERPEFYNTLTANCTTVVYQLAQVLKPDLPLDRRLVLSGYLPEYLADLGVLGGNGDMTERRAAARITAKAQAADPAGDYSAAIRAD